MRDTERSSDPTINAMLTKDEKILRSYLLVKIIETNKPLHPETISQDLQNTPIVIAEHLASLSQKGMVNTGETSEILGAYPVSALPTRHRIRLKDGRTFLRCAP